MIIKKGTLLDVNHDRKGSFLGIATADFDAEKTEFFPIALAQKKAIRGMANQWEQGEEIPCRKSLCRILIH